MNGDTDRLWAEWVRKACSFKHLGPLSAEEAQGELDAAPRAPLSEEEIERFVRTALSGKVAASKPEPDLDWIDEEQAGALQAEVMQLNRNPGQKDPETERLLEEYRRRALAEDNSDDKQKESNREDDASAASDDGR